MQLNHNSGGTYFVLLEPEVAVQVDGAISNITQQANIA